MLRVLLLGILLILIARAFWRVVDGVMEAAGGAPRRGRSRAPAVKLVRDPVCGTFVSPDSAVSVKTRRGTEYFCSDECRDKWTHEHAR